MTRQETIIFRSSRPNDCSDTLCEGPDTGKCTWGVSAEQQARAGGLTLDTAQRQLANTRALRNRCVAPVQLERGIEALEDFIRSQGVTP